MRRDPSDAPVVVLHFARLPLRLLGCYGNLEAGTPHIDAFAASAVVFDQCFAHRVGREETERFASQDQFDDDKLEVITTTELTGIAERLSPPADSSRQLILVELPGVRREGSSTEDSLHKAAAQVRELDAMLGPILKSLREAGAVVVLTSSQSIAFAESSEPWSALSEEHVHLPVLIHHRDATPGRSSRFVQPDDITATIRDLLDIAGEGPGNSLSPTLRGEAADHPEFVCGVRDEMQSLRTPQYHLIQANDEDGGAMRWLFSKPDDRWDTLDVAAQDPDVTEALAETLNEWLTQR